VSDLAIVRAGDYVIVAREVVKREVSTAYHHPLLCHVEDPTRVTAARLIAVLDVTPTEALTLDALGEISPTLRAMAEGYDAIIAGAMARPAEYATGAGSDWPRRGTTA
jgi:hypothetical protein